MTNKETEAAREYGKNKSTERFICTIANIRNNAITDFKAGIEWQKQQPLGLRWVNADERLPEKGQTVALKFWDSFGVGENKGSCIVDNHYGSLENNEVEWLDESLPAPVGGEGDHTSLNKPKDDVPYTGYYYDLLKFFNENYNLLLLDNEIQGIINYVNNFQAKEGNGFKIIEIATGKVHDIWKYIHSNDGEEHVWCNDWEGHHVIGRDCEWQAKEGKSEGEIKG